MIPRLGRAARNPDVRLPAALNSGRQPAGATAHVGIDISRAATPPEGPSVAAGMRFPRRGPDHNLALFRGAAADAHVLMKASKSELIWSLCVEHIPCGAPG